LADDVVFRSRVVAGGVRHIYAIRDDDNSPGGFVSSIPENALDSDPRGIVKRRHADALFISHSLERRAHRVRPAALQRHERFYVAIGMWMQNGKAGIENLLLLAQARKVVAIIASSIGPIVPGLRPRLPAVGHQADVERAPGS